MGQYRHVAVVHAGFFQRQAHELAAPLDAGPVIELVGHEARGRRTQSKSRRFLGNSSCPWASRSCGLLTLPPAPPPGPSASSSALCGGTSSVCAPAPLRALLSAGSCAVVSWS